MSRDLVESKLEYKGRSGKDTIYACPKCEGSDGHHLQVNYEKGYFNCFKCDFGGRNLGILLRALGIDNDFDYESLKSDYTTQLDDVFGLKKTLKKSAPPEAVDYSYDIEVSTEWFQRHSKVLSPRALGYLLSRGMTLEQIKRLGITEGINLYGKILTIKNREYQGRNYANRVMIPSLRKDGKISFFVARDYIGTLTPKYLNPPKEVAFASEDLYNIDIIDSPSIIICEGVMTAITAGGVKCNATATYGKSIADVSNADNVIVKSQGEKLIERKYDVYYICYDADAIREAVKSADYLHSRGAKVKLVLIDPLVYGKKADANSIGYEEFLRVLSQAIDYDPLEISTLLLSK